MNCGSSIPSLTLTSSVPSPDTTEKPNDAGEAPSQRNEIFREEALEHHALYQGGKGDLLRISPVWTRWTYWRPVTRPRWSCWT